MPVSLASTGGGSVTITPPSTASAFTQTLVPVTATLAPLVSATAQTSTAGTSIDFTSIPSWAKRITVIASNISTSGTSSWLVQIGSGSVTTTGYNSAGAAGITGVSPSVASGTTGFIVYNDTAADARTFVMQIVALGSSNIYSASYTGGGNTNRTVFNVGGGSVTLSGALDRVRITTVNGTDTFDAGTINIMYEG